MTKHRLHETKTDLQGIYNTEKADFLLENFTHLVSGREVVDPFVGEWHLMDWAEKNGATSARGYDVELTDKRTQHNDYFQEPVMIKDNELVVTNPPFLSSNRNKRGDRRPYEKFGQNDYYKCYLASLAQTNTNEAIIFMPTNFFCETSKKAREAFFKDYTIKYGEYWTQPTFDGVQISLCVIHIVREKKTVHEFTLLNRTTDEEVNMSITSAYGYRSGKEFWDYIHDAPDYTLVKTDDGMPQANTNIVVSLLDGGSYGLGLYYNEGIPIYCRPKSFTTYQITTDLLITEEQQKEIVKDFNDTLDSYRNKYASMFLSNYIDAKQKIMSRTIAHGLLSKCIEKVIDFKIIKINNL